MEEVGDSMREQESYGTSRPGADCRFVDSFFVFAQDAMPSVHLDHIIGYNRLRLLPMHAAVALHTYDYRIGAAVADRLHNYDYIYPSRLLHRRLSTRRELGGKG